LPHAIRDAMRVRLYEGGHMLYLRPESRRALALDAEQTYAAPIPAAPGTAAPPR